MTVPSPAAVPLSRNRNYHLLWVGQALAEVGIGASTIALPLLVLAVTGSAAASGLALATHSAAQLLVGIPGGALVDRWDRRRVMLVCEAVQALAVGGLALAVWWGAAPLPLVLAVAVVLGACRALFEPAEAATLPRVVPAAQLPSAVSMNAARSYLGMVLGTTLGGALFAARRWAPFGAQAVAHALSFTLLLFLRPPPEEPRERGATRLRQEILDGLRWVWREPLIRAVTLCAVGLNFCFLAFYLVLIAAAERRGVPPAQIGLMAALLGGGGILGALVAPRLHRALSPAASVLGVFWVIALLMPLAAPVDNGYLMGALLAAMAFLVPTANTTITTYQLLLTPDRLRGRLAGAMAVALGGSAVAGPLAGGLLAEALPSATAVLLCAAGTVLVALLATLAPTLRRFPPLPSSPDSAPPIPTPPVPTPLDPIMSDSPGRSGSPTRKAEGNG